MCRGKQICSELGENPGSWSKLCPLPPLDWFGKQLDIFQEAVLALAEGRREVCLEMLEEIRNEEIRDWYIEHGQQSGEHRVRTLKVPKPVSLDKKLRDPNNSPKKFEAQVFLRDGFRCRYCGTKLVSNKLLNAFIKSLNSPRFQKGKTNLETHGIVLIFNPVADHVIPWRLGGRTDLSNLVASCGPCNYGKSGYTIEQIGIENPCMRTPNIDDWDGLLSRLEDVRRNAV